MDQDSDRITCPFPRPIKVESPPMENDGDGGDGGGDSRWQAKESFPKLRLVRVPKSKQLRVNVNKNRKLKRISTKSPLPIQSMKKMDATEMQLLSEIKATFKNNIDRLKSDYEKKLAQQMAEMDERLRTNKLKKWCPICLKEITFDVGFNPTACSIPCWKVLLTRNGYLNEPSSTN